MPHRPTWGCGFSRIARPVCYRAPSAPSTYPPPEQRALGQRHTREPDRSHRSTHRPEALRRGRPVATSRGSWSAPPRLLAGGSFVAFRLESPRRLYPADVLGPSTWTWRRPHQAFRFLRPLQRIAALRRRPLVVPCRVPTRSRTRASARLRPSFFAVSARRWKPVSRAAVLLAMWACQVSQVLSWPGTRRHDPMARGFHLLVALTSVLAR